MEEFSKVGFLAPKTQRATLTVYIDEKIVLWQNINLVLVFVFDYIKCCYDIQIHVSGVCSGMSLANIDGGQLVLCWAFTVLSCYGARPTRGCTCVTWRGVSTFFYMYVCACSETSVPKERRDGTSFNTLLH